MQIVNIRAHPGILADDETFATVGDLEHSLTFRVFDSAPKNIGRQLLSRGLISSFAEWRFWRFPTKELRFHDLPLLMFQADAPEDVSSLRRHVARHGQPDVIWAEGIAFPPMLRRVFDLCPDSIRIVYPKYCEPWLIEGLEHYDACLVDEQWQIDEMSRRCPDTRCFVWDKLVDYERQFFPLRVPKLYDICYLARLHPRKDHYLLFEALAKLRDGDRRLSTLLVGSNENDCQRFLEPLAAEAGVSATFTGHVPADRVNELINQSRMGVVCDRYDAVPRAMLEFMAADIPVLVNAEMQAGIRYISPRSGLLMSPCRFHEGIREILEHTDRFQPREYLLENFSGRMVSDRLWAILGALRGEDHPG